MIGKGIDVNIPNVQKVRVFRFISHEVLKMSCSKHIEVRVWAWASLLGDSECWVRLMEVDYFLISMGCCATSKGEGAPVEERR